MRKKIITNITIIVLLFILVSTIFKINRIKLYRADSSLLFVKTLKSNSVYNEGDTVVVKDKFGNYVITNIFIDNNDGTYLTKKETSNYIDNFKTTTNNIIGLYSFRLKHFFSFWESKFVRFIFLIIAIFIVLKIRRIYIRREEKMKKIRIYNQDKNRESL